MRGGAYTAREREEAFADAERKLKPKRKGDSKITLNPHEIKTIPELFQPREFSYGFRDVDKNHVNTLKYNLEVNGKLDPVLVIKLGTRWVCVDGHHRIAAYIAERRPEIECEWFGGTVREAADEGMRRNRKDRLNVAKQDRYEEAWKRVLLNWGSIREIATICGVSARTVSNMRSMIAEARANDESGKLFRERLKGAGKKGGGLKEISWSLIKLLHAGVQLEDASDEVRAERLARRISARLTDLLSRDPNITARALRKYDAELPEKLIEAWARPDAVEALGGDDESSSESL